MPKKIQNLSINVQDLMKLSPSQKIEIFQSTAGAKIVSQLTPEQYASIFPRFFLDRMRYDVSGFTSALSPEARDRLKNVLPGGNTESSTGSGGARQRQSTATSPSIKNSVPSWMKELEKVAPGASDAKAKATFSPDQQKVLDELRKGQVSADDPRLSFINKLSPEDRQRAGIQTIEQDGKQAFTIPQTQVTRQEVEEEHKKTGKLQGGSFSQQSPTVMNRLMKDFNLTKEQAAGIIGNLGHESSGLQAGIQEKKPISGRGGLGWAQWTGPRRRAFEKYLEETGQSANDPEANYGFLKKELETTESRSLTNLRKAQTVEEATNVFERDYERAGIKHMGSRVNFARQAMGLYNPDAGTGGQGAPLTEEEAAKIEQKILSRRREESEKILSGGIERPQLPEGIDPKFVEQYNKMPVGQAQRVVQAIGNMGPEKFNEAFKKEPDKVLSDTRVRQDSISPLSNAPDTINPGIWRKGNELPKTESDAHKIVAEAANGTVKYQASVIDRAVHLLGLHERKDKETLKDFLKTGGKGMGVDPEATPWCSAFVNASLAQSGMRTTGSLVATSFLNWGEAKKASEVAAGDVLVQARGRSAGQTGGHVGLSTGKTRLVNGQLQIEMLGGNQAESDGNGRPTSVSKVWVAADKLQIRRAREEDYNPELLAEIKRGESTAATVSAINNVQQNTTPATPAQVGTPQEPFTAPAPAGSTTSSSTNAPAPAAPAPVGTPQESFTAPAVPANQQETSDDTIYVPAFSDGGNEVVNKTKKVEAHSIEHEDRNSNLKGDNVVVIDAKSRDPLFTMNTTRETAVFDSDTQSISVKPVDQSSNESKPKSYVSVSKPDTTSVPIFSMDTNDGASKVYNPSTKNVNISGTSEIKTKNNNKNTSSQISKANVYVKDKESLDNFVPVLAEGGEVDVSAQQNNSQPVDNNVSVSNMGSMQTSEAQATLNPALSFSMAANPSFECPSFVRACGAVNGQRSSDPFGGHYDKFASNIS